MSITSTSSSASRFSSAVSFARVRLSTFACTSNSSRVTRSSRASCACSTPLKLVSRSRRRASQVLGHGAGEAAGEFVDQSGVEGHGLAWNLGAGRGHSLEEEKGRG